MSSFSFCSAEGLIYDPLIKYNNNELPTNTSIKHDATNKLYDATNKFNILATTFDSSLPDTSMSFEECMDYLLLGNAPTYILITGNISDIKNARFIISEGKPLGYHNIDDNFYDVHFKSLTDPILNGTLFYTPDNDFNLRTQFLTDGNDKIDLVNFTIFKQSIRNTQLVHPARINPPAPDWDTQEAVVNDMDKDPLAAINKITIFTQQIGMETKKAFLYYQIEMNKIYAHNKVVSQARSDTSGKYWGAGYWKIFSDVDDNELDFLNIEFQTIKEPLKQTEINLDKVILKLDWTIFAVDTTGNFIKFIPVYGDAIKSVADVIKAGLTSAKLSMQQIKLDQVSQLYIDSDAMTWKISSEQSYRRLILRNVTTPNQPTNSDKELFNEQLDSQIAVLKDSNKTNYNRIFNYSDVNGLRSNYGTQIKYLQDIKDTFDMYPGWAGGCPYWVTDNLNRFNSFYNDTNNIIWLNDLEKQLYPTFDTSINAQISAIEKDKY